MVSIRPETVTVIFTDLVASTAWRGRVGADVADVQMAEFERSSRRVVQAVGGVVVKGVGDGVMATFDSATAALEAAAGLRDLARRLAIGGSPSCLRIGVSSGDLVREGTDWLGAAAIEAARLCAEADGGSVLVADTTVALIRGRHRARLSAIGPRELRGFSESIGVFELLDAELTEPYLPAALARASEFVLVGRHDERRRLRAELDAVGGGQASTVLLVGEPGVGKSRLAAAVAADAARQGFEVLHGRCDEGFGAPYQPVVEAFGRWLDARLDTTSDPVNARPSLEALWPELRAQAETTHHPPVGEPKVLRWRLFEDLTGLVRAVAADRPLLVVIDDLQWAEPSARAVLGHLARQDIPHFFLLATVRPHASDPDPVALLGDLGTGRAAHVLRLVGLPASDVADLIGAYVEGYPPDDLVRRLHRDTNGNPFFLRTLLRHLDDVAYVRSEDGSWVTTTELDAVGIPDGVRAVVHRRLTTLDHDTRRALNVGAVCGLTFDGRTVSTVLDLDQGHLVAAVDAAVVAGLVREESASRFSFVHALVQHTLLDDLTQTAVAQLHWRIAEALERGPRPRPLAQIALHYNAGRAVGPAETVLRSAHEAGEESMQRLAFDEAAAHFRIALGALDELEPDLDLRYRLLTSLGGALNALAAADVGDEIWLEAANLARQAGDPLRLHAAILGYQYMIRVRPPEELSDMIDALVGLVGPGDSPMRATALGMRAMAWIGGNLGRSTKGDAKLADEAVAMARRVGDAAALALSLRARLNLAESSGHDAAAMLRDAEELATLHALHGAELGLETGAEFRDIARALIRCGRASEVDEHLRRNREEAARSGERLAMNAGMVIEATVAAARGLFADAKRIAAEAFAVSGTSGGLETLRYGAQVVAVNMEEGRLDEVITALRQLDSFEIVAPEWYAMLATALAESDQCVEAARVLTGIDLGLVFETARFGKPLAVRHLAESCRLLDDPELAATLLPLIGPWSDQILFVSPGTSIEGAANRSIGHVLAVLGRLDEAVIAYTSAIELEQRSGFPPCAVRSTYWLARALLQRDRPTDGQHAEELLAEVAGIAGELGMRQLHERARSIA